MSQPRLESLIRQWRTAYGDQYKKDTGDLITSFLTEDGEVFSAQAATDFAVQAVNKLMQTLYTSMKSQRGGIDLLARELYEYVSRKVYGAGDATSDGTYGVKCQLPDDFGWLLGVRYSLVTVGGSGWDGWIVADLEQSFRGIEEIRSGRSSERTRKNAAFIEGTDLCVLDGSGAAWPSTSVEMTYLARQIDLVPNATGDILLRRFDYELVQLMKNQADFFQGQRTA